VEFVLQVLTDERLLEYNFPAVEFGNIEWNTFDNFNALRQNGMEFLLPLIPSVEIQSQK
jgi:hypothetical protein